MGRLSAFQGPYITGMGTLSVKQRAIYLSEAGLSEKAVAAVLGVDLGDVRRLMLEANPDIHPPGLRVYHEQWGDFVQSTTEELPVGSIEVDVPDGALVGFFVALRTGPWVTGQLHVYLLDLVGGDFVESDSPAIVSVTNGPGEESVYGPGTENLLRVGDTSFFSGDIGAEPLPWYPATPGHHEYVYSNQPNDAGNEFTLDAWVLLLQPS